jgi:hypothetical protein
MVLSSPLVEVKYILHSFELMIGCMCMTYSQWYTLGGLLVTKEIAQAL